MNHAEMTRDANRLLKNAVERFEEPDKSSDAFHEAVEDALTWDDDILAIIGAFGSVNMVSDYAWDLFAHELGALVDIKN